MPDLFLTKQTFDDAGTSTGLIYEIYNHVQSNGTQLYCLVQTDTFGSDKPMPMIEFADMDRDGMTDMVYYDETVSAIYTMYNKK